jgi:hypothetical protein
MLQVGWLTVVGLVADIAGASVLAWDILPEYRIYRWRAQNRLLHQLTPVLASELKHYRQRPHDPILELGVQMAYLSPVNALRHAVGISHIDFRKTTDEWAVILHDSKKEVTEAINAAALQLNNRWRPPLRTGIVLIVIGFLFQLAGQLGSMHLF